MVKGDSWMTAAHQPQKVRSLDTTKQERFKKIYENDGTTDISKHIEKSQI